MNDSSPWITLQMVEHLQEHYQNCIPEWAQPGKPPGLWWLWSLWCSGSALFALLWNPVHFWPGNEILTWQKKKKKNPSFKFQTITQILIVLKDFAKYAHEKYSSLKWENSKVFHHCDCCNKCDGYQKFLHNWDNRYKKNKAWIHLKSFHRTSAVNPTDSFNRGEPFHPCGVLGQYSWNWKVGSRPLK